MGRAVRKNRMIALSQYIFFSFSLLVSIRYALVLIVFFLAFSPRSLGLIFNNGNLSLTFERMAIPTLIFFFVIKVVFSAKKMKSDFKIGNSIKILFILSIWKILSTMINGANPIHAINDAGFTFVIFYIAFHLASEKTLKNMIYAMGVAIGIMFPITIIELVINKPLHYLIADQVLLKKGFIEVSVREGAYRIQGIFDNPLLLNEFAIFCLPLFYYMVSVARGTRKRLFQAAILIAIFIIIFTGSRSGLLVGTLCTFIFVAARSWYRFRSIDRYIILFLIAMLSLFILYISLGIFYKLIADGQANALHELSAKDRSSVARAQQFFHVSTVITESPIFGAGVLQNFSRQLDEIASIDNYYLRVLLEAGVVGLLLFVLFLYKLFSSTKFHLKSDRSNEGRSFFAMCVAFFCSFIFIKLFLSIPTNNIYFYAFSAAFLRVAQEKRFRSLNGSQSTAYRPVR